MRTLANDEDVTFIIPRHPVVARGYIFAAEDEGRVFIMKHASVLKDHYTEADREYSRKMNAMTPLRDGDEVLYDGKPHKVKILGNYSDAGRLVPIE